MRLSCSSNNGWPVIYVDLKPLQVPCYRFATEHPMDITPFVYIEHATVRNRVSKAMRTLQHDFHLCLHTQHSTYTFTASLLYHIHIQLDTNHSSPESASSHLPPPPKSPFTRKILCECDSLPWGSQASLSPLAGASAAR